MKKVILSLIGLVLTVNLAFAESAPPKNASISSIPVATPKTTPQPQYTTFSQCIRTYQLPMENLLYTCLSAINENNFQIEEIQFKTGTVIFTAYSKEFILVTAKQDIKNSFVKILPVDNNYNFSASTINRIFKYIDLNSGLGIQNLI